MREMTAAVVFVHWAATLREMRTRGLIRTDKSPFARTRLTVIRDEEEAWPMLDSSITTVPSRRWRRRLRNSCPSSDAGQRCSSWVSVISLSSLVAIPSSRRSAPNTQQLSSVAMTRF